MVRVLDLTRKVLGALLLALLLVVVAFLLAARWRETGAGTLPPAAGRLIETPLGKVFVEERGAGKPLLIIGGTAAWGGFWSDVAETLAKEGYRTVAVDLPPFGYSERRPDHDYDRGSQAERLHGVIRGLGLVRPVVLGHSFGAGAVMELAARHGGSLGGIVVVCGALALPEGDEAHKPPAAVLSTILGSALLMQPVTALAVTNPLAMRPLLATMLHRKEAADARQAAILLRPMSRPGTTEAYAAWLPNLLLPERSARTAVATGVAAIQVRTAFIWGENDTVTPLPQGVRLTALVRGATLDVMPGVGHIPHIEAPEAFLARLRAHLRDMAGDP